mmetsp:Transcript_7405/g.9124  ORF Transcript_7405/g.9124 Transcript_7405/m.9124 type:complete len:477 (-) Transcript_7405:76-1506(-)
MEALPGPSKTIVKQKRLRACDSCRESKKKCDGKLPCGRCEANPDRICTYAPARSQVKTSYLLQLQKQHLDQDTRKQHILAYFKGANPIFFLNPRSSTYSGKYDAPSSKSVFLQYNAMLATSIREAGAERSVYETFETTACSLASELLCDFTYETALGYNILAFHFWGEDIIKSVFYRDVAISLTKRALRVPEENYFTFDLLRLLFSSMCIHRVPMVADIEELIELIPEDIRNSPAYHLSDGSVSLAQTVRFSMARSILDNHLLAYPDNLFSIHPGSVSNETIGNFKEYIRDVARSFTSFRDPESALTRGQRSLLQAISLFGTGQPQQCFTLLDEAMDIFSEHDEIIIKGGPFFGIVLHTIFVIAFNYKKFDLAHRVSGMQKKHAAVTPTAQKYFESDFKILQNYTQRLGSAQFAVPNVQDANLSTVVHPEPNQSSPFNWMSTVSIPVISQSVSFPFAKESPPLLPKKRQTTSKPTQ